MACGGVCLLGVCLHVTAGDLAPFPFFVAYYALPRPVLCGLAVAAQVCGRPAAGWRRRAGWLATATLLAWVLAVDVGWRSPDAAFHEGSIRVAFWNAAGRPRGWDATSRDIAAFDAELIGLVECGRATNDDRMHWRRWFPEYRADFVLPGLGLLFRGEIFDRGIELLDGRSFAGWWDVELSGRRTRVFVVDVASNPLKSRWSALTKLRELISSVSDRPVIVMGDFNTPLGAPSLSVLSQAGLKSATTLKGRGYRCTWPVPLPVLTLDQIWTSSQFVVQAAGAGWSWNSDHRPVSAVVTFGTAATVHAAVDSATTAE